MKKEEEIEGGVKYRLAAAYLRQRHSTTQLFFLLLSDETATHIKLRQTLTAGRRDRFIITHNERG